MLDVYTIKPAELLPEMKLDPNELTYRKTGYDAEADLKGKESTVTITAQGNEGEVFNVPMEDVELQSDKKILDAGVYTITAIPTSPIYVKEKTAEDKLTIKLQKVDRIVITVNGVKGLTDGENRLGGPDEKKYHSISLKGMENEPMTVVVSGATGSITLQMVGGEPIPIIEDSITFKDSTLKLDTTGDVEYTITASYDDGANLKDSDDEKACEPETNSSMTLSARLVLSLPR